MTNLTVAAVPSETAKIAIYFIEDFIAYYPLFKLMPSRMKKDKKIDKR
jgi:hypothetical protein